MCIASGSFRVLLGTNGIVGSSYVMVFAAKCIMACVSGKGPLYGDRLWYQLVSGIAKMVTVSGSCFDASLAQCSVCCAVSASFGCAYPIPFHLY